MPFELPPITPCPWIDAYKPGIDMTGIRENLKLTPTERLENGGRAVRLVNELAEIGIEVTDPCICSPSKIAKLEKICVRSAKRIF